MHPNFSWIPWGPLPEATPTKSDQIQTSPTKSDQIRPNPTDSHQFRPILTDSDQFRPIPTKFTRNQNLTKSDLFWPILTDFDQFWPIPTKSDRVRPNWPNLPKIKIRPNPTKSDIIRRSDSAGVDSGRGPLLMLNSGRFVMLANIST